jgi:hypothetical protein
MERTMTVALLKLGLSPATKVLNPARRVGCPAPDFHINPSVRLGAELRSCVSLWCD